MCLVNVTLKTLANVNIDISGETGNYYALIMQNMETHIIR